MEGGEMEGREGLKREDETLKVGCHGPRTRTEIYCRANLTLNLRVDSEYVVA